MQDTKNLIVAIALSTVILFSWQYFYAGPKLKQAQIQAEEVKKTSSGTEGVAPPISRAEDTVATPKDRAELIGSIERVKIDAERLHGSISLKGARFDDLTLADYKADETPGAKEVVLLSPSGTEEMYFAEFGWLSANNAKMPDSQTVWYTEDKILSPGKPVKLSWDNNAGLKFFITIDVDDNYMFKISQAVENYGQAAESLMPYGIINRKKEPEKQSYAILHEGTLGVLDEQLHETRYKDLKKDKKQEFKSAKGWVGVTDKYWLTAIVPSQDNSFDANFSYFYRDGQDGYQVDYSDQKFTVNPGQSVNTQSHFFAGAKEAGLLDKYATSLEIPLFDRAVDLGHLYFITKPIFKLLTYFHFLFGNFGIAILMLTVVIKLIMFPLANKSYVSMHHLKRLQPQMVELKERYKNDKVRMNKAIMELYKEEKVNPMAGCLPLFVQIPIFFALYKVLFVTIEMRQAPFFGWIHDLSAPDPTTVFNLFGLIPWNPPAFLMLGIWPIIMGVSMYLQQKMNPQPADPIQAKVMKMLPFLFVFIFAKFPAGLVIYWAWNNTLSILQQWVITRRLPR